MLRARQLLFAVVILLAPLLVVAAPARADTALAWSDCSDGFQCATIGVPMDYDDPHGTQLSLAMIKLPATDPATYSRYGASEDQRVPYFGPMGVFDYMACAFWPAHDVDRYPGQWNRVDVGADPRGEQPVRPGHPAGRRP